MKPARLILASDRVARGEREDRTAAGVREVLAGADIALADVVVVSDEVGLLEAAIRQAVGEASLVLTSGGTGLAPRDVTPEATRRVIDREVPGLAEAMRAASLPKVPTAALSRALAGTAGQTLVLNLPGSPAGARECLEAVLPAVVHGMKLLEDAVRDCAEEIG